MVLLLMAGQWCPVGVLGDFYIIKGGYEKNDF